MSPHPVTPLRSELDTRIIWLGNVLDYQLDALNERRPIFEEYRSVVLVENVIDDRLEWTTTFGDLVAQTIIDPDSPRSATPINFRFLEDDDKTVQDERFIVYKNEETGLFQFGWINLVIDGCRPLNGPEFAKGFCQRGTTDDDKCTYVGRLQGIQSELATLITTSF